MKRLILLRHGKSSWDGNLPDEKRPLQERAIKDAKLVAQAFEEHTDYKFTVWSSKAVRAKTTAKLVVEELQNRIEDFHIKEEFYTFDASEVLKLIRELPEEVENMMLVGHNPAYTHLVNYFCKDVEISNLPTSGLVELEFDTPTWSELKKADLNLHLFPKHLRQ
jgi:phosphohistidine phosphatase